ncbi:MAG: hypothetical protein PVH42_10735, partial [Desulfobacterales bacterium]
MSRKDMALSVIRSLLVVILALALSQPKLLSQSDQVNAFFCLDISESIPRDQRQKVKAFIEQTTAE